MTSGSNRYRLLHELSPAQTVAADVLDGGGSHLAAATAAGVARTTVSRWATKHPAFIAEINRRKTERAEENARRIREVTRKALDSVGAAIENGDTPLSMQWLRSFGLDALVPAYCGPTTPEGVVDLKRRALPSLDDPVDMLDAMDGRTTERALEEITSDLDGFD